MTNFDRNAYGQRFGAGVATGAQVDQGLRSYMLGVYNNMVVGLGITGLVALGLYLASVVSPGVTIRSGAQLTEFGRFLYLSPFKYVLIFAPLAVVFFLSFKVSSMSVSAARVTFYVYAALMGASLSIIGLVYAHESIARVFFITAASFGALSLYGYTTKRDLSGMGSFLMMGMFGLIIASLVNIFLASSGLQWAISIIGVLLFAGLTAYDTQNIKEMYYEGDGYAVAEKKSILGALQLYMDFIGMFQFLMSIMGNRE
ncbi:MAG: Bax inhibitor-1/YccA family protein [Beijerinckiaceae bacterium]|nr:Bax inhibitor-1/YccA family protein [Beijerinckiaceae bacterium]